MGTLMEEKNKLKKLLGEEVAESNSSSYTKNRIIENVDGIADLVLSENLPTPKSIEIHPTTRCVNDCRFCIGQNIMFEKNLRLSYDVMKGFVDGLSNYKIPLIFSGNHSEPFLNSKLADLLQHIIRDKLTSHLLLFSNLFVLNDELVKMIASSEIDIYIGVGLYGYSEDSYTRTQQGRARPKIFRHSLENTLKLARASATNHHVFIDIHYIATPSTIDDLNALGDYMKHLLKEGVSRFMINTPLRPISFDESPSSYGYLDREQYLQLKEFLLRTFGNKGYTLKPFVEDRNPNTGNPFDKCYVQYFFPTIGADGVIYPCCYTASPQGKRNDIYIGEVSNSASFMDTWGSSKKRDFVPKKCCPNCSKDDYLFNLVITKAVDRLKD